MTTASMATATAPLLFISPDDLPVTSVVTVVAIGSCARTFKPVSAPALLRALAQALPRVSLA
ncbi:hypothetical protein [Variovorax sp. OK605]|uniref:hypothetical protein n=1 Tax=Variovorax sp. OK605 TaxID=1855317 RepID=UPI00116044AA|nr:hypothetical protein [Variovorax sp. OK605]